MSRRSLPDNKAVIRDGVGGVGVKAEPPLVEGDGQFVPVNGETVSLSIKDIPDMSVYSRNGFVFSDAAGIHYEIKPIEKKSPLNVRKYISVWKRLKEIQK